MFKEKEKGEFKGAIMMVMVAIDMGKRQTNVEWISGRGRRV